MVAFCRKWRLVRASLHRLPSSDVSECYDESLGDFNDESVDATLSDIVALPIITDVLNGSFTEIRLFIIMFRGYCQRLLIFVCGWRPVLVLQVCFVLLRPETPCFSVPGFQVFHSPFVACDPSTDARFYQDHV